MKQNNRAEILKTFDVDEFFASNNSHTSFEGNIETIYVLHIDNDQLITSVMYTTFCSFNLLLIDSLYITTQTIISETFIICTNITSNDFNL